MTTKRRQIVRVEDLVGRRVRSQDGRVVGRLQEICVQRRPNGDHEVTEYHLGTGALLERMAIVRRLLGRKPQILIARWHQLDIHRPDALTLTCAADELRREQ